MRIALMMPDNPFAPNGAAGYMKRLYDNRGFAMRHGLGEVTLCHGGVNFTDPKRYVASLGGRAKQAMKGALAKTRWGTRIAVKTIFYRRGENAIKMYDAIEGGSDVVVFNEFATHDLFLRRYPDYDGLKVQILHDNGEFGKMLMLSMPKVDPDWVKSVEKKIISDSDVIVHVGARNKELFEELHPECTEKSVHVHTGIDDLGQNPFRKFGDRLVFVCVGTVCARKNQVSLLEVAQDEEIRTRCRFVVVGGGPEHEFCKAKAADLGLSDIVSYVGPSSHVVDYYRSADAFISVSVDEGLPTVALEAMSCGLPLVLTDVGGCSELIDGNGVLVPTCVTSAIVSGVKEFLGLLDAGKVSGERSRVMYERNYTTEVMWREYVDLIQARLIVKDGEVRG